MEESISVIIPVYNEEQTIEKVLRELGSCLKTHDINHEIIAVNDESTDNTQEILKQIDNITLVSHPKNKGYGASLKTGIKKAKNDWILIIDADATYPIDVIPALVEKTKDYDLIIGSRQEKNKAIPLERRYAKIFLNKFASYLAGQKIPDLNSGLRIFKKDIALKYWDLFPEKFSFTSTLTMICLTHGYETIFVPIEYYKRKGKSSIRPVDFLNFLKLVAKLSLFFKPIKVFGPIALFILFLAVLLIVASFIGITPKFLDTTFTVLCATALQTFFFGLLAEIVIHNR